jgi:hypothetical protein
MTHDSPVPRQLLRALACPLFLGHSSQHCTILVTHPPAWPTPDSFLLSSLGLESQRTLHGDLEALLAEVFPSLGSG